LSSRFNIKLYFTIAISCGLRPQELIALKWSDFDGENLTIQRCLSNYEIKETTKTGRSRRVFVPTWARSELLNAPSRFGKNWIFPNTQNNNLVKPEVFNEEWARIHAELKIPYGKASNRTPYTCRHTRAAELLTNGVPPAKGAEQLGNSVQVFLATYAEWIEEYSGLDNALLERKINTERGTKGVQNPILDP
jgi:integrase